MAFRDRTAGYMPGQAGVLGVNYTATFPKTMMDDSRLLYVNPNHADAADDGNTGENPEQPFLTVAAALVRCRDNRGDVIFVGQNDGWQWGGGSTWQTPIAEEVIITVDGVSLVGIQPGAMGVPWNPVTAAGAGTCITVNAVDVLIEGFNFFADTALGGTAIAINWNGTTTFGDNTEIAYCQFNEDVDSGIVGNEPYYTHIHHCWFQYVATDGIIAVSTQSMHIHDCTFLDAGVPNSGAAISLVGTSHSNIHHNYIYNSNAQAGAAATNEGINMTGGNDNIISCNWFSCILTDTGANGDWGDLNSGGGSDAWCGNWCTTGLAVTTPS